METPSHFFISFAKAELRNSQSWHQGATLNHCKKKHGQASVSPSCGLRPFPGGQQHQSMGGATVSPVTQYL